MAGAVVAADRDVGDPERSTSIHWWACLAGTMAAALAMLGPGRWSVDARLFGWKRIDAPVRKRAS